ncbi:hypothetical protein FHS76_000339 [Ochrobactrum daejeonense]|uniref:Uncharacterized protein n=1 Tax=Brucella daejeonensis TaxID=659015 RepID=A0A7W9ELB0_9HYPH|nr:hypothetical protein [Brucella daejeonensis]
MFAFAIQVKVLSGFVKDKIYDFTRIQTHF